jgi:hypothetical protein
MWMDALLDAGLGREPLAERTHVAVPQRLARERAEERVPAGEPEPLSTVEPAVDGLGRIARQRGRARLVTLPVEEAERAAGGVQVSREERERATTTTTAPPLDGTLPPLVLNEPPLFRGLPPAAWD